MFILAALKIFFGINRNNKILIVNQNVEQRSNVNMKDFPDKKKLILNNLLKEKIEKFILIY